MKKKLLLILIGVSVISAAGILGWIFLPQYLNLSGAEQSGFGDHEDHENCECSDSQTPDHGQDHEDEEDHNEPLSMEDILTKRCEHDTLMYQCNTCRFEVGVVKVDSRLMRNLTGSRTGLVKTITVSRSKIKNTMPVTGEVQLNENRAVHISPRISGIIRAVHVDIGAEVKAGDILFDIDSVELGQAKSEYEKNCSLMELSRKNFEREKTLFEKKISTEREMIDAQMAFETYKTELKAAEQKLLVLGLSSKEFTTSPCDTHKDCVGCLPVMASLDGTIIEKHAVVGELVKPGSSVMLLADLRKVWVWANIYEQDLAPILEKYRHGPVPVEVFVHAFPNRGFKGQIDYIGATMDERTRTIKVRATIDNSEKLLRPGMFCEIKIQLNKSEEVMTIPKISLLSDKGPAFVFKHMKDDYYVRWEVKTGRTFNGRVEILGGLNAGETIIADGAFLLKSDILRKKLGAG